jgi:hypothetical protein
MVLISQKKEPGWVSIATIKGRQRLAGFSAVYCF